MKKTRKSMAFRIIGAVVSLLVFYSVIVGIIGYLSFTGTYKREYKETTYHMAVTATALVNGNNIDYYLKNGKTEDYLRTEKILDSFCKRMHVSIVYVIRVDTKDYNSFTSVFNVVDNTVDNSNYSPWQLGYVRKTSDDKYKRFYKNLYSGKSEYEAYFRVRNLGIDTHHHITMLVPVKNDAGAVTGLMCIQRPMSEYSKAPLRFLTIIALSTLLLAIIVALIAAYVLRNNLVDPIKRVINEAHRFAKENTKGEALAEKNSNINEICDLSQSIDTMESDMLMYIENLTAVTSEKERIGAELSIASTIQENAVPHTFPAFPERNDIDIFASMTPAKEVGGDFYNFFLVDDDHLGVVIADVSGKGVPAALFMMVTNILVVEIARLGLTPAEVLTNVNNRICAHNEADMFVTVWLGILEISTGKMIASNAGHDDPVVYRKGENFEFFKEKRSLVVGAVSGINYKNYEIQLNKGDKLFLYTDGLPEATDKDNNMFTLERMATSLNKYKEESPERIISGINSDVGDFVGDAPQFDDLTMLCLELKEEGNKVAKSLKIEATNDNLAKVAEFVDVFLEENGCGMKAQMQIDLSVEEIFVNIANYAYGDETGNAEIQLSKTGNAVSIVFIDSGIPYNPLEKEDPDTTLSAEERKIGGLGIFLVKKNMNDVLYEYKNGQNILTLIKEI
ncbi:MAG: SpoIIE family protein phosphatase [Eubacterium sp.]|nr:SpoIIE family protein phosphatase [Eubacterium sp.]